MSWFLVMTPLHRAAGDGGLEWAAGADSCFGLPGQPPSARDLPTVGQVLAAVRDAGCHGVPWFQLAGHDVTRELPDCPDPAGCAPVGGLDLGEVSLGVEGVDTDQPVRLDQAVTDIRFRKPSGPAVLATAVTLASRAGPLLLFDDGGEHAFVVSPGDDPTLLTGHWPW